MSGAGVGGVSYDTAAGAGGAATAEGATTTGGGSKAVTLGRLTLGPPMPGKNDRAGSIMGCERGGCTAAIV